MNIASVVMVVLLLSVTAVEARFYWPWEQPHGRRHAQRGNSEAIKPLGEPNCQQIREAIKTLEPDRLERALRSASRRQRDAIDKCQQETGP
jgi:hypothetical protein